MATRIVDTVSGNDTTGDGSLGNPYFTVSHAAGLSAPLDTVKVRGGATYAARRVIVETIELRTATGFESGTAVNPITITNYDGEYIEFQNFSGVPLYFNGIHYWTITTLTSGGLEGAASTNYDASDQYFIRFNCNQKDTNGFGLRGLSADGIKVRYCHIDNGDYYGMAVNVDGDNWQFYRCRIGNNFRGPGLDASGIHFESLGTQNEGGEISYCIFYELGGDGFVNDTAAVAGTRWNGLNIHHNTYRGAATPGASENFVDLKAAVNAVIDSNTISGVRYNNGAVQGSGVNGSVAIEIHEESLGGHVISNNVGYNNSGALVRMTAPGATLYNNIVYSNVDEGIAGFTPYVFEFYSPSGLYYLYNNVVYGRHGTTGRLIRVGAGSAAEIANNAFIETGTFRIDAGGNLTATGPNGWYNAAQMLTASGDVVTDPQFIDLAGYNFNLQATSPYINAGVNVGLAFTGSAPDLGAREYTSAGGGGGAATGSVVVASVRFAFNTATGTQDITTADLGGLTPKAVLFFITGATADGTAADNGRFSMGSATSASQENCVGVQMQDAQATTNTDQRSDSTRCIFLLQVGSNFRELAAELDSFITNGCRINITAAPGAAYFGEAVFFAGASITNAYTGYADLGNTLDGVTDITAPGFRPNVVIPYMVHSTNNTASTNARFGHGFVFENGAGTVTQRSVAWRDGDGDANVITVSNVSDLYGIHTLTSGGAVQWGGEFGTFDASGFSVTTRVAGASNTGMGYLALAITGVDVTVMTFTAPAATGVESTTSPGYRPQAVLMGLTMATTVNTVETDGDSENFGFGVWTATRQSFSMVSDDDNAADSNTYNLNTTTRAILLKNGAQSTNIEAEFDGFTATGWDLNYTTTAGSARRGIALVVENTTGGAMAHEKQTWPGIWEGIWGGIN